MNTKLLNYNVILLQKIIREKSVNFVIQEEEVPNDLVCSSEGLVGLFLLEASHYYEEMFEKDLNLNFYEDSEAVLETQPVLAEDDKNTASVWSYLMLHVVEDVLAKNIKLIARDEPVPLDGLYEKWMKTEKRMVSNPYASPSQSINTSE